MSIEKKAQAYDQLRKKIAEAHPHARRVSPTIHEHATEEQFEAGLLAYIKDLESARPWSNVVPYLPAGAPAEMILSANRNEDSVLRIQKVMAEVHEEQKKRPVVVVVTIANGTSDFKVFDAGSRPVQVTLVDLDTHVSKHNTTGNLDQAFDAFIEEMKAFPPSEERQHIIQMATHYKKQKERFNCRIPNPDHPLYKAHPALAMTPAEEEKMHETFTKMGIPPEHIPAKIGEMKAKMVPGQPLPQEIDHLESLLGMFVYQERCMKARQWFSNFQKGGKVGSDHIVGYNISGPAGWNPLTETEWERLIWLNKVDVSTSENRKCKLKMTFKGIEIDKVVLEDGEAKTVVA